MDIETFYRGQIYLDCSSDDWEKIENKFYKISYKHANVEASSFEGCPAAGPYLTMVSLSKQSLEDMIVPVRAYLSKFKHVKVS